MNENKYYIPTIDEFHVGFEYERLTPRPIATESEFWDELQMSINFLSLDDIDDEIIENEIRVKYLDKDDIESFGFIKNDLNMQQIYTDFFNMNKDCVKNKCPYRLYIDYDSHLIMIKYPLSDGQILFNGTIKNKSELKTLLKQLGIYNERN